MRKVANLGANQMIAVLPLCPPPFFAVFRYSVSVLICTGEPPFWWRVPAETKATCRDVRHLSYDLFCLHCILEVIYQTRETALHRDIQTPRTELKIRRAAEYLQNSRCLHSRWNNVSSIWYIFSIETKTKK